MARHRAPDVVAPLHGVNPTGTGRPRHAAGLSARVAGPDNRGRHRGPPSPAEHSAPAAWSDAKRATRALEFLPPLVVVAPEIEPVPSPAPTPPVAPAVSAATLGPALEPIPASEPEDERARRQSNDETVAWAGFACLVSAGVVSGGQGPRAEAIWTLSISGAALSMAGLTLLGLGRRRTKQGAQLPQ